MKLLITWVGLLHLNAKEKFQLLCIILLPKCLALLMLSSILFESPAWLDAQVDV